MTLNSNSHKRTHPNGANKDNKAKTSVSYLVSLKDIFTGNMPAPPKKKKKKMDG